jgi:MYND finger
VYAGCVKRIDGEPFLWKDLHWNIDKSELLRRTRTEEWNKALGKYCDDMDLVGEDRERAVARHKASACTAPRAAGSAATPFSRCRMIAYCGRACQKLDWAHHRRECDFV